MARLAYTRQAFADLRAVHETLADEDPTLAANSVKLIRDSLRGLEASPLQGRVAEAGLRERAISRGRTGYVALFRFLELDDVVLVLAIRHRRDAGYPSTE